MKILVMTNSIGGLYCFRKELIEQLTKQNQVIISAPSGDRKAFFTELGCKCIDTSLNRHGMNPLTEIQLFNRYMIILETEKPDVCLTYTIKPNVYGGLACQIKKVPYIANITGLGTAVESDGILQKSALMLYKLGLRKAKKVFFQNTENRDFFLQNGIIKNKYDLLPGSGVNLDEYTVSEYPNGDTIDFVFVSRIMKEKGIDQYLDAAKYIRKKYPQTRFHVYGACEEDYSSILRELHDNGTIIYHGVEKNMKKVYQQMSCTVHPSYYPEGMSNVLLESCASGRPIITTDRAGCREIVDDGINGFMVKQNNSLDLIDKIEVFLCLDLEKRKMMGINGREKVEKEFSRKIVVDRYIEEINR